MRQVLLCAVVVAVTAPLQAAAEPAALVPPPAASSPTWSHDAREIIYHNGQGFEVVDVATRRARPLPLTGREPAWSPSGGELLVVQSHPAPPPEPRPCSAQHPDWICIPGCPVPFRLLSNVAPHTHHDCWPQGEIFAVTRRGEETNLTQTERASEASPAWSRDGSTIAFQRDNHIWTMRRDGTALRQVTTGQTVDYQPAWSADASTIAFVRNGAIWVVGSSGGDPKPLVAGGFYALNPSWSPDGKNLVFAQDQGRGGVIMVVNSDGSAPRELAKGTEPEWSPDGRWIAFVGRIPPEEQVHAVYVVRPDGSGLTRLTGPSISPQTADPACTKAGTPQRDRLLGTAERDFVCALAGADSVAAGGGDDTVLGGEGRDVLAGGAGSDEIDAGPGADRVLTIESRAERDIVRCGKGADVVHADRLDAVAPDCERVVRRARRQSV